MATRILLFDEDANGRALLSYYLKEHGYEVLGYAAPLSCELVSRQRCTCPRPAACADVMIAGMTMPGMNGLDLIRLKKRRGCHLPPQNKAVASVTISADQSREIDSLGCRFLQKPFNFSKILAWVRDCEKNIPHNRTLVKIEDLWLTSVTSAFH